jgi:LmbE family N-acetylglucosaminyl deacetylase
VIHSSVEETGAGVYDAIYLSPHLDDAILSAGGAILTACDQGMSVLVATVCTRAPGSGLPASAFARKLHDDWGVGWSDVLAVRLAEDECALAAAGADGLRLGFLDAVYRCPQDYDSEKRLLGAISQGDPLQSALDRAIGALAVRQRRAGFFLPLAVGGHVDHQITHRAYQMLAQRGAPVRFYEDLPYAMERGSVTTRLRELEPMELVPEHVDITSTFSRKLKCVGAYRTQVPALFGSVAQMKKHLSEHASGGGDRRVERLWRALGG